MKAYLYLTMALVFSMTNVSARDGAEGHGGTPNPQAMFREAAVQAADLLEKLEMEKLSELPEADKKTVRWIEKNRLAWKRDVLETPHHWPKSNDEDERNLQRLPEELRRVAAYTELTSKATIIFSNKMVRKLISGMEQAVQLLLHESLHHFGIEDEVKIDFLVDLVYRTYEITRKDDDEILAVLGMDPGKGIYPKKLVPVCASLPFPTDRKACLEIVRNGKFDMTAVATCRSLNYGTQINRCFRVIRNHTFHFGNVNACVMQKGDTIQCLEKNRIAIPVATGSPESDETSQWMKFSCSNYPNVFECWGAIERTTYLTCENWQGIEYTRSNWRNDSCRRERVGLNSNGEVLYRHSCQVEFRCLAKSEAVDSGVRSGVVDDKGLSNDRSRRFFSNISEVAPNE